jgi:hypothetical protein
MLTKWNMTLFLFLGVMSSALLLGGALRSYLNLRSEKAPYIAIAAPICASVALAVLMLTINSPSKLLNILGHTSSGLSSAVIADIVMIVFGMIIYTKYKSGYSSASVAISAIIATGNVYCFSRIYMIITRPALDTPILSLTLIFSAVYIAIQLVGMGSVRSKSNFASLAAAALLTLLFFLFTSRLVMLPKPDRVLHIARLITGDLSVLYWAMISATTILPLLLHLLIGTKFRNLQKITLPIGVCGLFLLTVLINQMPIVSRGVDGRFFY